MYVCTYVCVYCVQCNRHLTLWFNSIESICGNELVVDFSKFDGSCSDIFRYDCLGIFMYVLYIHAYILTCLRRYFG